MAVLPSVFQGIPRKQSLVQAWNSRKAGFMVIMEHIYTCLIWVWFEITLILFMLTPYRPPFR